jgi:2-oxoisovalerate dehydrogenase E1 component alpha subunit
LHEFGKAEKESKPALENLFGDVYCGGDELERPLREQKDELKRLIGKWGESDLWRKELERFEGGKKAVENW